MRELAGEARGAVGLKCRIAARARGLRSAARRPVGCRAKRRCYDSSE
jgi:hypothetical protein